MMEQEPAEGSKIELIQSMIDFQPDKQKDSEEEQAKAD